MATPDASFLHLLDARSPAALTIKASPEAYFPQTRSYSRFLYLFTSLSNDKLFWFYNYLAPNRWMPFFMMRINGFMDYFDKDESSTKNIYSIEKYFQLFSRNELISDLEESCILLVSGVLEFVFCYTPK